MTCITLPGSTDICFVTETSLQQVIEHLNYHKITILAGPAERVVTTGPLLSIYIQEPDGNLIEISNLIDKINTIGRLNNFHRPIVPPSGSFIHG